MTRSRWLVVLGSLSLSTGCGSADSGVKSAIRPDNACTSDAECGSGVCVEGFCASQNRGIDRVFVEVVEPVGATSGLYGNARYLVEASLVELANSGGAMDIALEPISKLSVGVQAPQSSCEANGADAKGFLPIRLSVSDDRGINGIAPNVLLAESDTSNTLDGSATNLVALTVPPGPLELYIEPAANPIPAEQASSSECDLAPVLALHQTIRSGQVSLLEPLPVASHLSFDIRVPIAEDGSTSLGGWVIDMVEPLEGRRISNQILLGSPTRTESDGAHYAVTLAYHEVVDTVSPSRSGAELLRVTPPANKLAPTYYISRSAMDLFNAGQVLLTQVAAIPAAVQVSGSVESEVTAAPLRADVIAILEPGNTATSGAMASFRVTAATDEKGQFELPLLAGTYRIYAVPSGGAHATYSTRWTVAASPSAQAGKLIRVGPSASLTGVVSTESSQRPLANAMLVTTPSSVGKRPTFLDGLLGNGAPIGVRSQMGVADENGAFELQVDPGRHDVFVQPADTGGYPWAVRPSTTIDAGVKGLLNIQVRNPVAHAGSVFISDQNGTTSPIPLPGAILRFYALFDENGQLAEPGIPVVSAVQIGETRADAAGSYRVLVADRLD